MEDDGNFGLPFLPEWKMRLKPIVPQRGNPAEMEDGSGHYDTRFHLEFWPEIRPGEARDGAEQGSADADAARP